MTALYKLGAAVAVLLWALGASWLLWKQHGATQVAQARVEALEADLEALHKKQARATALASQQAQARATSARALSKTREEIQKEDMHEAEPRPVLSDARRKRLQRLADEANRGIDGTGRLP